MSDKQTVQQFKQIRGSIKERLANDCFKKSYVELTAEEKITIDDLYAERGE